MGDSNVLTVVVEEFDNSACEKDLPVLTSKVQLRPATNIMITGLAKRFSQKALNDLLNRFGTVAQCKLLPPGLTALVQMQSEQEAAIVFEDLSSEISAESPSTQERLTVR